MSLPPAKSTATKLLTLLLLPIFFLSLSATTVLARDPAPQGVDYTQHVFQPAINSQDVNLQSTVYEIWLSLISSISRTGLACSTDADGHMDCVTPEISDSGDNQVQYAGAIPDLLNLRNALITNPPVSHQEYLAHVSRKLNLASPAYAQGLGYEGLRPALVLWQAFRNIGYLLTAVGFVVLAFMIMFRVKMSPQTVVTVQTAMTKLIIVVLAITFSYAIAGLIVDLLFVFSFVIITMFRSQGLITVSVQQAQETLFSGNIFQTLGALISTEQHALNAIHTLVTEIIYSTNNAIIVNIVGRLLDIPIFGGISSLNDLLKIIIEFAIIFSLLKVLWQVLSTYLEIIFLTILGPLMILPDILPGGRGFQNWAKRLFANAMVFPTLTFMILFGVTLAGGSQEFNLGGSTLDFSEGLQIPFLRITSTALPSLLGLGVIFLTPKVVDMVKGALKVSGFGYGVAIGAALGYGTGAAKSIYGAGATPFTAPTRMAYRYGKGYVDTAIQEGFAQHAPGALEKLPGGRRLMGLYEAGKSRSTYKAAEDANFTEKKPRPKSPGSS